MADGIGTKKFKNWVEFNVNLYIGIFLYRICIYTLYKFIHDWLERGRVLLLEDSDMATKEILQMLGFV